MSVQVTAEVFPGSGDPAGNNVLQEEVRVEDVTIAAPADQLDAYRTCRAADNHRNCVGQVPYHPIPDESEVMKLRGEFMAIAPAEFEQIAAYSVADDAVCVPRMREHLGIDGPPIISGRTVVADDYSGGYAAPFVQIYSLQSYDTWVQLLGEMSLWWRGVLNGECSNAHELTHLMLGDTPMPGWLEEGLATFVQDTGRTGYQNPQPVECRETGWYGWDMAVSADAEVPYQDLMVYDPDVFGIYYYYTGMCFWDHLEKTYGEETVRRIVRETAAYRDTRFNGCTSIVGSTYFIRDIVNPIIGTDITPLTQAKWGFGETYTGCEA